MRWSISYNRLNEADQGLLNDIRTYTKGILREVIGSANGRPVAILGTPRHRNLGDSLIWRGELDYVRQAGLRLVYTANHTSFRDEHVRRLPTETVVLCHGGGNLGDRYLIEERFRRHIVASLGMRHQIVVLPQTMSFAETKERDESRAVYSAAPNLTMLLRDDVSLERARLHMPDVHSRFCPDLAFGASVAVRDTAERDGPVVILARDDAEVASSDLSARVNDWRFPPWNELGWKVAQRCEALANLSSPRVSHLWFHWADSLRLHLNVAAVNTQFAEARAVATNRLHGHILACLAGVPHFVADTAEGKVKPIFEKYSGQFTTAHRVPDLATAIECASQF